MVRLTRLYGRFDIKRLSRELPSSLIDRMRIFVDGERIRTITIADTHMRWVEYVGLGDDGKPVAAEPYLNRYRLAGDVRIYVDKLTGTEAQALLASGRTYELGTAHPGCRG